MAPHFSTARCHLHAKYAHIVMEYLGGGEIKWRTEANEPVLRVSQTRRICRDVILGLEYRTPRPLLYVARTDDERAYCQYTDRGSFTAISSPPICYGQTTGGQ